MQDGTNRIEGGQKMVEKSKPRLTRAERQEQERAANLRHWEEQDAHLFMHRREATDIGGASQAERLAKQGKKPMRELIGLLIDPGSEFFELGLDAGYEIGQKKLYGGPAYEEEKRGHIPGGGVITGVGVVHGKDCMILANENRYAAGTYFPITLKKHIRAQAIAEQCGLPCIYIADSGGINLPLQIGCFADDGHFGTMFYNMCRMSAKGIKQYTLSTGGNTAGGAYIVYLASESIMIEKLAYAFLAGPPMVKSAIGENVSMEDLGGAYVHTHHSGGCDHLVRTQEEGVAKLRAMMEFEPGQKLCIERRESRAPRFDFREMMRVSPINTYQHINIRETINCLADDGYFHEYKAKYGLARGESIVCGKMWLKGIPVGVIASNASGVIYIEAARKATEWMIRCGNSRTPVLFRESRRVGRDRQVRRRYGSRLLLPGSPQGDLCDRPRPRGGQLRDVRPRLQAPFCLHQHARPDDGHVRRDRRVHPGDRTAQEHHGQGGAGERRGDGALPPGDAGAL
jgi:3-methylcrotonyl-CoA carboxylase beta subunit